MNEQERMKKSLIKNMLINFIVFTILFLIFDFIIFNQISNSLYRDTDDELIREQRRYSQVQNKEIIDKPNKQVQLNNIQNNKNNLMSPRIVWIVRNENGEIINSESMGRIYEEYGDSIEFDKSNLMKTYTMQIDNKYTYRCLNFETTNENGEKVYVQFLANVDGETQTLNNLLNMLIIGTGILITISIGASYVLSKRMMDPIYSAYKKQTEFVENASHEIRTPLTIIQAKQELLLQEPDSKILDKSEDINLTLKETKRLTKMIKELMSLARADNNDYKLNREKTDIDKLIKEVTIPYIDFAKVQEKDIVLDLQYGKEIKIDKNKIIELLIILLDNAIKYTEGKDTITIKTYTKDGKCNIEVQDTGVGISDEGLKRVFDRFYREDKARSRATGGTDLGLSIAHTIVTNHKGTIKAMHNEPKGTIILVKI